MSLSILLLYKNTQEVNSHGLVGGLLSSSKLYPFMYRGRITKSELTWNLGSGYYFHGVPLYDNGSYGVLIVIVADSYIVQLDINLTPASVMYRSAHNYGDDVDTNWTKLH